MRASSPPVDSRVTCPVCGQACSDRPLYRYRASDAAAHFCSSTRDADRYRRLEACIRSLWQTDECAILRCGACGFGFGWPHVGGDETFYTILHEQKGYPRWRWDYDVGLREALQCVGRGRILDIGAGQGAFLRRLGPGWDLYAVEASESNRADLTAAGITVFRDLAAAARAEAGTFQVVTLFQVLEHIADFRPTLSHCRQLLCAGGLLVVTVPDGDAMIRQERITGCADMPPNHVNKWTPKSLALAFGDAGFAAGPAIPEPPSWRKLRGNLYLRIGADARNLRSATAQIYRIPIKHVRAPLLACLGLPALIRMLRHAGLRELRQGGAFGVVGVAR